MIKHEKLIETKMMREIIDKTLSLHPSGIFVWYRAPSIGKSVTTQYLLEKKGQDVAEGGGFGFPRSALPSWADAKGR